MANNNYFESFRQNTETIDDVLAFLNKYMSNVSPDKDIKVKIGQSICTDMIGNIYLTIDCICEYLDKSSTVKDASLKLLGHVLHEFMHWVFTDKNAWDNGVSKYSKPQEQKLMQYLINSIEDGRGESAFMNKYYGSIYPLLYSNNAIDREQKGLQLTGLEAIMHNIIMLSVSYRVKDFDLSPQYQKLQDDIVSLMQDRDIWSLSSTQSAVEVADEIFSMIMDKQDEDDNEEDNDDNQQQQDSSSSQQGDNQDGDSSNQKDSSSDGDGEDGESQDNQQGDGQQDSQSGQKGQKSNDSSEQNQSDGSSSDEGGVQSELDNVDFDKLQEAFKNYKDDEAPGRDKGYEEHTNHDDYIDFSNIVNELDDITEDDVKIPELDALSEKYDKDEDGNFSYTKSSPESNGMNTTVDNQIPSAIPDLTNLPDEVSSHQDINMKIRIPKVSPIEREIYEKNKFSLETDIEELLFLLRSILNKKIENQTEEVVYSGLLDQDKLLNIGLSKWDIFEVINDESKEIDNSIFIGIDLSGSMIPRQKHITKSLIMLHEVLKSLGVKHAIWGFNTFGKEVHHHPFITFDNCNDDDASYNLGALKTYGENRDGYSIRFFHHYIQEKGANPLYITMTDGNPNHYMYSGKSAIADTKVALESMGLPTIAFCIGDKENMNIQSIYDNSIECEEVHELPELLHEFLLDVMH